MLFLFNNRKQHGIFCVGSLLCIGVLWRLSGVLKQKRSSWWNHLYESGIIPAENDENLGFPTTMVNTGNEKTK